MFVACSEIIWRHGFLYELGFIQSNPTSLYANNTSVIHIVTNPIYHERTKHIEIDCRSIRQTFKTRTIYLSHVSTTLQVADINDIPTLYIPC